METTTAFLNKTVSQIVRDHYRTADVFKAHGINYCCGGAALLSEACALKGIDASEMVLALERVVQTACLPPNLMYREWTLDFLVDYIINVHHVYLREALPKLEAGLLRFVSGHKKKQPFLEDLLSAFQQLAALLRRQTAQEEESLFPYIKQLHRAERHRESYGQLFVKTLRKPLQDVGIHSLEEHLSLLRGLTNRYSFTDTACTNHRVIFQQLQELDNDLVQHTHLENNVLLPLALQTEQGLLQAAVPC